MTTTVPPPHLDDALLARLAVDDVSAAERGRAWTHAEGCPECAARLHAAVMAEDEEIRTAVLSAEEHPSVPERELRGHDVNRGDVFGRYIILDEIGQGGLGRVYAAFDPELDRRVAIKVLRLDVGEQKRAELLQMRMLREARAMAKITHPNVVTVHDVGLIGQQVFIAMELVQGLTLRKWVQENRPDWSGIRDVMVQAARGLESAHQAGMIHRDFKPSNVLVTADGRAKVLDFGLVRGVGGVLPDAGAAPAESAPEASEDGVPSLVLIDDSGETLTRSGLLMGTPGYIAPEQYRETPDLDDRLDQFSFCVTLYELLYRRRPYRGTSLAEIETATLTGQISSGKQPIELPGWLPPVIRKGIATEREDRFDSMEALITALERDKRARVRNWRAVLGVGVASGLIGAGVAIFWAPEPTPEARSEVETLTIEARAAAAKSYFVYPPVDTPDTPTAYSLVLEIESIEGDGEALADEAGEALRSEFSETLVRLGDQYWETEGGMPFASDYYAAALMFDPDIEHAQSRVGMTPGQLASLRRKATEREFSQYELAAAESLAALAEPDEGRRAERLAALYDSGRAPSVTTAAALETVVAQESPAVRERVRAAADPDVGRRSPPEVVPPVDDARGGDLDEGEIIPDLPGEDVEAPTNDTESTTAGDTAERPAPPDAAGEAERKSRARTKAREGKAAYDGSRLKEAERLFHQALSLDRRNATALVGLAEIAFDRGNYRSSVKYGKLAVGQRPKSKELRILLGDAYFKVLDYEKAKRHYEKARDLGSSAAAGRLKRLDGKLAG